MLSYTTYTTFAWLAVFITFTRGSPVDGSGSEQLVGRQFSAVGPPYANVQSSTLLGWWPFLGSYNDFSAYLRGPALVNGTNVALAYDSGGVGFVQIRQPGFLSIPSVDIQTTSWAIDFKLRIPAVPATRQVLLTNWKQYEWQYMMYLNPGGTMSLELRRNIATDGSNPLQGLVDVTTAAPVPVGVFKNIVFVFDKTLRSLSVFVDGILSASSFVPPQFADLTLHNTTQSYVQLGSKADDNPVTGKLNADISQLIFYQLTF